MKVLFTIFILLLIAIPGAAQERGTIYGRVTDAVTGQPLPGVNILVTGTDIGAATDLEGNYSITGLSPDNYILRASSIGYSSVIKSDIRVSGSKPVQVDFNLQTETIILDGVTVTSGYFSNSPTESGSIRSFGYEEIRRAPGGFEDVIRALSVLPGVAQADAGRNDLIVRGGAPSENLYLIDGIEVPNINHFGTQGATGGPLSFVNLDYVRETSFSTGGFSVLYGDKLSSVLTIDLRNGRKDRIGGKATVSASQFGLNLEGPVTSRSDFIFSVRRSYLDLIFKAAGFSFVPEYYDVLSKYNFRIDNSNSISFLFISAFDNVRFFNDTGEKRYDNSRILGSDQVQYVTGLSYRHLFSSGFIDIILSRNYTDFDTRQKDSLLNPLFTNTSLEAENSLRTDLVQKFSEKFELNTGVSLKQIKFRSELELPPFVSTFGDTLSLTQVRTRENFLKASAYANLNTHFFPGLKLNFGLRSDYFNAIENKFALSPRISASYMINERLTVNASAGMYSQSPSYIWLATNNRNRSLNFVRANHYISGIDYLLREDALLKIELFYKDYSDYPVSISRPYLVLANTGAGFSGSDDNFSTYAPEPLISAGNGNTRGVEFSLQKKLSEIPFYGIFSLTWSQTKFTALDGLERRGAYDQTWIVNLSGGYKLSAEWEISSKFRYATGKPYTPFNPDGTQSVGLLYSARFPANHSLDLRVDKRWFFSSWTLITYIDIQNIYNRNNQTNIRWDPRTGAPESDSSIGILPSIGISAEF